MIQRVQTIFLFVLGVCMILCIVFPIWEKVNPSTNERATLTAVSLDYVKGNQPVSSAPTFYIVILAVAAALVAFYSISRFRNRLLQIKLGALNSLLMAGVLGLILYFSNQGEKFMAEPDFGTYTTGFYLPIVAMVCNILANRFIRRDERLVRSADRMR